MKRILSVSLLALCLAACSDSSLVAPEAPDPLLAVVGSEVKVTNSNNSGNGSFRAAVEKASSDPSITRITFNSRLNVKLQSGVVFSGAQDLTINGNRSSIDGSGAGGTAFLVTGGGDLSLLGLTVRNAPGDGIAVEVPGNAPIGTIKISLIDVEMNGNKGFGFLVNDQLDPSSPELPNGDPLPVNPNGSPASLEILVAASRFIGNGFSVRDRDGLRVNEGGDGNLKFTMTLSLAQGNGADGVELDERGPGDVVIDVSGSLFLSNGPFFEADLDDGFDIDEYNAGNLIGKVTLTSANSNFEEGFDFNENDDDVAGDSGEMRIEMLLVGASFNREEGIDLEEDDDFGTGGNLIATLNGVTTIGNGTDDGDGGLKIREKELGDLTVSASNILSRSNQASGIYLHESSGGNSTLTVDRAISNQNDPHGFQLVETGAGVLTATLSRSTASQNQGNGVFADAAGGTITLNQVTLTGNVGGATGQPVGGTATFTFVP